MLLFRVKRTSELGGVCGAFTHHAHRGQCGPPGGTWCAIEAEWDFFHPQEAHLGHPSMAFGVKPVAHVPLSVSRLMAAAGSLGSTGIKFYAYGGVPLGPLPGLGCCAHGQLGGCVPVAGWLFHESSSGGVLVQSLLIAAAGR